MNDTVSAAVEVLDITLLPGRRRLMELGNAGVVGRIWSGGSRREGGADRAGSLAWDGGV